MITQKELFRVLDRLEIRESELLCWGDTNGYFSDSELLDIIEDELPAYDPEEVEEALEDRGMVVDVSDGSGIVTGTRTRTAEAVHLFRNLRQWFPGQNIDEASTLVSDYRYVRQRRKYPKRDLKIDELVSEWSDKFLDHNATREALIKIADSRSLSGFQARATERVLTSWERHQKRRRYSSATIICAGTGSGKTMAFYLPALSGLATDILRDNTQRVRILAIYPRQELLKDQFNDTYWEVRKLDSQLEKAGARKIRIGALFGDTPNAAKYALEKNRKTNQDYFSFEFLKCSTPDCQGEMRWSKSDIDRNDERLECSSCHFVIPTGDLRLTRRSMMDSPPDILFTTTEMLNQRISDSAYGHLFGIDVNKPLPLVLIDEVHTYEGKTGAQTAMVFRRWMHRSRNYPHFVGLSATLRDAKSFFSELTSTKLPYVESIEVEQDELEEEGAEYLLALRGDPVAQKALLSTTIQTAMLTRRILDHPRHLRSKGVWGSKTFAFTDNLDVTNRLFSRLADAEGFEVMANGNQRIIKSPLATLRNAVTTKVPQKKLKRLGQDWSALQSIGHSLEDNDRVRVAITSSQESGYEQDAEIIVTTPSLEVGFNDPKVGAVIQHKAPREASSYLQRKGRAGRPRNMRPWMIIVLSDFGLDRIAYQQYENLIDPEIQSQGLPTGNIYLLKMQAAQAVLDWLNTKIRGSLWVWLNQPKKYASKLKGIQECVEKAMVSGIEQDDLESYIRKALVLDDTALNRVLWQSPRSVFLEFLPTLNRYLTSEWGTWSDSSKSVVQWAEVQSGWESPVPGFIPKNLFDDLNAPDLHIQIEELKNDPPTMRYFQGLNAFAPGNISMRFSNRNPEKSDWMVPECYSADGKDKVVDYELREAFGEANIITKILDQNDSKFLTIYQPREIFPKTLYRERKIADTSKADLRWESRLLEPETGDTHDVPRASNFSDSLIDITFFTHSMISPLEIIHYNTGSDATVKLRDGGSENTQFKWVTEGQDVGIGARLFVDAVNFQFSFENDDLLCCLEDDKLRRAVRVGILKDRLVEDPVFFRDPFTANWVYECFMAAVFLEVSLEGCEIPTAVEKILDGQAQIPLQEMPEFLFQTDLRVGDDDSPDAIIDQKLQENLREVLESEKVLDRLKTFSGCLYQPIEEINDIQIWIREVLARTLAAALHQAVCTLNPHTDDRSIHPHYDVDHSDKLIIWLYESESGGLGVVDELRETYNDDPLKVLHAFHRSLQPGDYEQLDADLYEVLSELVTNGDLADSFLKVRASTSYEERLRSNEKMRSMLIKRGFIASHSFFAVLHSRILRAGSTAESDKELLNHLDKWDALERKCELELPIHIVAKLLAVGEVGTNDRIKTYERACEIQSLLWVRGSDVRDSSLKFWNPFVELGRTERLFGALICRDRTASVEYSENWLQRVHEHLNTSGYVDLLIPRDKSEEIPKVLATLYVKPLDTKGLLLYPRVRSVNRRDNQVVFKIEVREAIY